MSDQSQSLVAPEQSLDEKALVAWLDDNYRLGRVSRLPFERAARLSLRFWVGDQWSDIEQTAAKQSGFDTRKLRPDATEEVRLVNNRQPIYCRQILAGMMSNLPDLAAVPSRYDPEADESARIGTRLLQYCLENIDHSPTHGDLLQSDLMWLLGSAEVLRVDYWDAKASMLAADSYNFFSYVKDPYSADEWPARWVILYDARDVDWIEERYGVKVEPENVSDAMLYADELAYNVTGAGRADRGHGRRDSQGHAALLKRRYIPPSAKYPQGQCWIWASGKLLTKHALQGGVWPLQRARWMPIPGRLYPLSLIELLLSDQRRLNALLSQYQEALNRELRGDIITSGPDQGYVETVVNPRTGAKQLKMAPETQFEVMHWNTDWRLAQVAYEQIVDDLNEKAGTSKSALGQDLSRIRTLGELQLAHESQFASLGWHLDQFAHEYMRATGIARIQLARKFMAGYRELPLEGDKEDFGEVTGEDLRHVRGVRVLDVPRLTPAMKRRAYEELTDKGLLGPWPTKAAELAARTGLRERGLTDIEDQIAQTYGPFEELQQFCREQSDLQKQAERLAAVAQVKAAEAALTQATAATQPAEQAPMTDGFGNEVQATSGPQGMAPQGMAPAMGPPGQA